MAKYCQRCQRCQRLCDEWEYYRTKNITKYPDGRLKYCKKCITKDIDVFNPDTFLWVLKEIDVPYIQGDWNRYVDKYGEREHPAMAVLGHYLSKMKLHGFKNFGWKDTSFLAQCERYHRIKCYMQEDF